jgi:uncharacterized protein with PQ loop repeat
VPDSYAGLIASCQNLPQLIQVYALQMRMVLMRGSCVQVFFGLSMVISCALWLWWSYQDNLRRRQAETLAEHETPLLKFTTI